MTSTTTTFRPEMKSLYLMVDRWARDCLEGRGELSSSLRRIIQMLAEVPGLELLARDAEADRDTYFALLPIPPIRRSPEDLDEELFEAVGEDIYEETDEELEKLSERWDPEPPINPLIHSSHVAHTKYFMPACLAVVQGMVGVFKQIGEWAGQEAVFVDPTLIPDLRLTRLEIRKGYTRSGVIQKVTIQGLFIISYAVAHESVSKITLEDAAHFFTAAVNAIEWSYAVTNLHGAGWSHLNRDAAGLFMHEMVQVFAPAAKFLETMRRVSKAAVELAPISEEPPQFDYPFAFFLIKKDSWLDQSETMIPEPFEDFPYKSTQEGAGISLCFGRQGVGKTSILFGIASQAMHEGSVAVVLKSDLRNQATYFRLPAFGKQKEMREIVTFLVEKTRVKPHPFSIMTMNVLRPDEKDLLRGVPLTDCDRFVWVRSTQNFHFDWKWAMKEFWRIHQSFPFDYEGNKPKGGIIVVRYLHRLAFGDKGESWNEDLQVAANLSISLAQWRQTIKKPDILLILDELHDIAAREARGGEAASDKSSTAGQINQAIINTRGVGIHIVGSSLLPLDTIGPVITSATNTIFRNLSTDQAKTLLERGGLLQGIPPEERELALALNDENWGAEDRLFWWHRQSPKRELNVLRPIPPPIFMDQTAENPLAAFKAYEEEFHTNILLEWNKIDWKKLTIADETQTQPRTSEVQSRLWAYDEGETA